MSTIKQLFAPNFYPPNERLTDEVQNKMAEALECDSLRYLPVESVSRAIGIPQDGLCQACITCEYPTPTGQKLYQLDYDKYKNGDSTADNGARAFDLGKKPPVGQA